MSIAHLEEKAFEQRMARIEGLIDQLKATGDPGLRATAMELMQSLMELHGAALARMMKILSEVGEPHSGLLDNLARDDLVASLLLLYGLHPLSLETRVQQALDKARPYLRSHGGDVKLIGIDDGVVRIALEGTCKGCPSSAVTLRLAVEDAIYDAAPDVTAIESAGAEPLSAKRSGLPPARPEGCDSPPAGSHSGSWETVTGLAVLADGVVQTIEVSGRPILFCRIGENYYAYDNTCPGCNQTFQPGQLHTQRLICSTCERQYDLVLAGRSLDEPELQLEPFPLLMTDGRAKVAIPEFWHMSKSKGGL
ncbi:MAG: NifU family protein [Candidatus Binatia bacterium]